MKQRILSTSVNSQAGTQKMIWPLSVPYGKAAEASILMSGPVAEVERVAGRLEESLKSELGGGEDLMAEFYEQIEEALGDIKRIHPELSLTTILSDENNGLLIATWNGSVILKRGGRAGMLASGVTGRTVVKAGEWNEGDILVLFNSKNSVLSRPIMENLGQARSWTELVTFAQGYFNQPEMGNLGLIYLERKADEKVVEMRSGDDRNEEAEPEGERDESENWGDRDGSGKMDGLKRLKNIKIPKIAWAKIKFWGKGEKETEENEEEVTTFEVNNEEEQAEIEMMVEEEIIIRERPIMNRDLESGKWARPVDDDGREEDEDEPWQNLQKMFQRKKR